MSVLEQLENQFEHFCRLAWSSGISRPGGTIPAIAVPAFAEKLARCKTEEAAKSEMFANPAAAQAFWIWSEALIDGMKKGLISTKAQNPPPTYCVELLAAMVLTYCNHTIQQEGPDFAFEVP